MNSIQSVDEQNNPNFGGGMIFPIMSNVEMSENQEGENTLWEDDEDFDRAYTAPARPLTDIEEFRRSNEFLILEKAVLTSQQLILKGSEKYDLDTLEG